MKVTIGDVALEISDDQADELRRQLGVSGRVPVQTSGKITADEAAAILGVSRETVYRHAAELGGQRIGAGPKSAWRFDPAKLARSGNVDVEAQAPQPRRRRRTSGSATPLLEVRGDRPYASVPKHKAAPGGVTSANRGPKTPEVEAPMPSHDSMSEAR